MKEHWTVEERDWDEMEWIGYEKNNKANKSNLRGQLKRHEHAIAVLTRIHAELTGYDGLIRRSKRLLAKKWATDSFDFVFFHEPRMPMTHKNYIIGGLRPYAHKIFFEDVSDNIRDGLLSMNTNNSICPATDLSSRFSYGYKGMCYFWYGGFIRTKAAGLYKSLLRVDDDCLVENELEGFTPFCQGNLSTVAFTDENPTVMVGMDQLFQSIAFNRSLKNLIWEKWKLPYTNVMCFDLDWVRSPAVQLTLKAVYESGCIISNRWGDLPLWGATAALLNIDIEIIHLEYRHESHNTLVSPGGVKSFTDTATDTWSMNVAVYSSVAKIVCIGALLGSVFRIYRRAFRPRDLNQVNRVRTP